VYVSQY